MSESNAKTIRWILLGVFVFVAVFIVAGINTAVAEEDRADAALNSLSYFTDFSLNAYDGKTLTDEDIKAHRITLVNAWAPWCPKCVAEMPYLEEASKEYADKGVLIVGIVADYPQQVVIQNDYDGQIAAVIKDTGATYPNVYADDRFYEEVTYTLKNLYPGTWILDSEGRLIAFHSGALSKKGWEDLIDGLLAETEED